MSCSHLPKPQLGALGGVARATPKRFRAEPGAATVAMRALAGGTALALLGAAGVVKATQAALGVSSAPEFAAVVRTRLRSVLPARPGGNAGDAVDSPAAISRNSDDVSASAGSRVGDSTSSTPGPAHSAPTDGSAAAAAQRQRQLNANDVDRIFDIDWWTAKEHVPLAQPNASKPNSAAASSTHEKEKD